MHDRHSASLVRIAAAISILLAAAVPRPAAAQPAFSCAADCNDNGAISISELLTARNIVVGTAALGACTAADVDGNGSVGIHEVVLGVNFALSGCPLLPDLTVDPGDFFPMRRLLVDMPGGAYPDLDVLRVGVGTSNLAAGRLQVERVLQGGPPPTPIIERIGQRLFNHPTALGAPSQLRLIDGDLIFHPAHMHVHFSDWTDIELIHPTTLQVVAQNQKVSFCLEDVSIADPEIAPATGLYEGACDSFVQGISPGWKDVYGEGISGQFMVLPAGITPGIYALRAEVDPQARLVEETRSNNLAATFIQLPAVSSTLDCSDKYGCCPLLPDGGLDLPCGICKQYFCHLSPLAEPENDPSCQGPCGDCTAQEIVAHPFGSDLCH